MKYFNTRFLFLICFSSFTLFSGSCVKEETPTRTRMQGNWHLTSAQDESGNDILSAVAFPVTAIQLTDDNGMLGLQAPLFTRIVYGPSKWIQISADIEQVFDYLHYQFSTGEFFVAEGVTDRFTVEAKLKATAALGDVVDILNIMGIQAQWLQSTIYHKFIDVKVTFSGDNTMIWEFDSQTQGAYNTKDSQGNYVLWQGWPVNSFQKGKYTFTKITKTMTEMVDEYK